MNTNIFHWGRFEPLYKDYSLFNKISSRYNVTLYLSNFSGFNFNTNINIVSGYYSDEVLKQNTGSICLLPYLSVTQSGVLPESIQLGYVPIVPNLYEFDEFLPYKYFSFLYYESSNPDSLFSVLSFCSSNTSFVLSELRFLHNGA